MGSSFVTSLRSSIDVLYSPQLENYLDVFKPNLKENEIFLHPRIVGTPVIVDLEGDGHNEIIVAVNYVVSPDDYGKFNHRFYSLTAVVAFDLMIHQVKWISQLELSAQTKGFHALLTNGPTVIDVDGNGELNIIVGSAMGHIHVLDNYGCPIKGFPVAMGPIFAPVVVEDIDQDGNLEIIGLDSVSTVAVFSKKGKLLWDIQITPDCVTAPAIADIDNNGILDMVIACNSGAIHVMFVDQCFYF